MKNKSKTYLAPLVLNELSSLIDFKEVIDTFLYFEKEEGNPSMYLVLTKEVPIEEVIYNSLIIEAYEFTTFYVVKIDVPEKYNFEYLAFKNGKYSYYRPENKEIILNYLYKNVDKRSKKVLEKVIDVFSRNQMLREHMERLLDVQLEDDAELTSKPSLEEETFNTAEYGEYSKLKKTNSSVLSNG